MNITAGVVVQETSRATTTVLKPTAFPWVIARENEAAIAGPQCTVEGGAHALTIGGKESVVCSGAHGISIAGDDAEALTGPFGVAIGGSESVAAAGVHGVVVVGPGGSATAGEGGVIILTHEHGERTVLVVGQAGICANTYYALNDAGVVIVP